MKTIKFFEEQIPIRYVFFFFIGLFSVLMIVVAPFLIAEKYQCLIPPISIFSGIIYLFVSAIFLDFSLKIKRRLSDLFKKKTEEKEEVVANRNRVKHWSKVIIKDAVSYYLGLFWGMVLVIIFGIIFLAGFGLFHLGKLIVNSDPQKLFGVLSAVIVLASYPPYIIRVWQRKIVPNIASWIIFVLVSIAIALSSYASSGAGVNSWVTLGPLLGCTIVLIIALIRSKEKSLTKFDIICLILGIISIAFWMFTKQSRELVQFALYIGILADFMGILPSIKFLSKNPEKDRPALWIVFSFGYFLSMFAITEHTFANWILPVFMTLAPALVWIHLVKYRVKNKIPLKEWI